MVMPLHKQCVNEEVSADEDEINTSWLLLVYILIQWKQSVETDVCANHNEYKDQGDVTKNTLRERMRKSKMKKLEEMGGEGTREVQGVGGSGVLVEGEGKWERQRRTYLRG